MSTAKSETQVKTKELTNTIKQYEKRLIGLRAQLGNKRKLNSFLKKLLKQCEMQNKKSLNRREVEDLVSRTFENMHYGKYMIEPEIIDKIFDNLAAGKDTISLKSLQPLAAVLTNVQIIKTEDQVKRLTLKRALMDKAHFKLAAVAAFDDLDGDGNHVLELDELDMAIADVSTALDIPRMRPRQVRGFFKQLDTNHDAQIDEEEFEVFFRRVLKMTLMKVEGKKVRWHIGSVSSGSSDEKDARLAKWKPRSMVQDAKQFDRPRRGKRPSASLTSAGGTSAGGASVGGYTSGGISVGGNASQARSAMSGRSQSGGGSYDRSRSGGAYSASAALSAAYSAAQSADKSAAGSGSGSNE